MPQRAALAFRCTKCRRRHLRITFKTAPSHWCPYCGGMSVADPKYKPKGDPR